MSIRTGIAIATLVIEHLCRILTTYRTKIDAVVEAAKDGGFITSVQQDILNTWLDGAQTACNIIKIVSGY